MAEVEPFQNKFIIGTKFIYGWDFVWSTEDDNDTTIPDVYDTREEAESSINDDIESIKDAIECKNMEEDSKTTREDYIIAQASMDKNGNVVIFHAETTEYYDEGFSIFSHY